MVSADSSSVLTWTTFLGFPVIEDPLMPRGRIELRDRQGRLIGVMSNFSDANISTPAGTRSQPAPTTRALPTQDALPDDLG